jgi:hypothetical protein
MSRELKGEITLAKLTVTKEPKAREALADRGAEVCEVDEHPRCVKYVYFSDPDGNTWALQEMPANQ